MLITQLLLAQPLCADVIDGEELVDPTRPIHFEAGASVASDEVAAVLSNVVPASYELSFVRVSNSPMAIINAQRVTVGDVVGAATVIAIDRNGVTLSIDDEERRISVYESTVTAPVLDQ